VLVLEYVAGGELLDVVNSDEQHAQLGEKLLQRIWRELVGAVEWIHAHLVVHRDIKLESASFLPVFLELLTPDSNGVRHTFDK
jgi:protein-serine/threonine kinase